jgi:signal transduction histidine kinase
VKDDRTRATLVAVAIAHDIDPPPGAIRHAAGIGRRTLGQIPVLAGAADDDEAAGADRAGAVIAGIRGLVTGTTAEPLPLRLRDLLADVFAVSLDELAERRIAVRATVPAQLPGVVGDRAQLRQLVLELVANAAEAMAAVEDNRRRLALTGAIGHLDGRRAVRLDVRDRGVGFDPAETGRLFAAFYTTKAGRLGMGLRICRSIVESHGGRLWAAPTQGHGSTFRLLLPAADPPPARSTDRPARVTAKN